MIIEFKKTHLKDIKVQQEQKSELKNAYSDILEHDTIYTLLIQNKPMAILGLVEILPQVANIWGLISKDISITALLFLVKEFKRNKILRKYKRLQITCQTNFINANRLCTILGMQLETPNGMMNYNGHDSYNLYSYMP